MRLAYRISFFEETMRWAIAELIVLAVCLGGLWCLIALITGLLRKARRGAGKDRCDANWQ